MNSKLALGLLTLIIYSIIMSNPNGVLLLALAWMLPVWVLLVWEVIIKDSM